MMKGDHGPTIIIVTCLNTWGAFDHASHVPQVRACNYYLYKHIYKVIIIIYITMVFSCTCTNHNYVILNAAYNYNTSRM